MTAIAKPTPADVGRRVGLRGSLSAEQLDILKDAIADAVADVEAELSRSIIPVEHVLTEQRPRLGGDLTEAATWDVERFDDRVAILAAVENPQGSGLYDLTVQVGLDGASEGPIVRFITAHAVENLRSNPDAQMGSRLPISISAEGQSLSFNRNSGAAGQVGSAPDFKMLRRYKRRALFRRDRPARAPWPYDSMTASSLGRR